ncbi:GatB/YqeY domain-containing protein [Patescibacteria group bacterium]|nr:GatB/YqeY domain-containing protein [Patescibacteria group bacterium]
MSLEQTVIDDYKQAFKDKDESKKGILNYIYAQLKNKRIETQKDLSDDDVISVIKKEIKSRNEAIEFLEKAGKTDDIALEKNNIAVLQHYVPEMLSEEALRALVQQTIATLSVQDLKAERGKVVGAIMATHKSAVDGKMMNDIIMSMI